MSLVKLSLATDWNGFWGDSLSKSLKLSSKSKSQLIFGSIVLLVLGTGAYFESISSTQHLALLSSILLMVILVSISKFRSEGFANPLVIFSIMYAGYGLGGYYYSSSDGYFGKFLEFIPLGKDDVEYYLVIALIYAIISFILFSIGYGTLSKVSAKNIDFSGSSFWSFYRRVYPSIVFVLLLIGFLFWVYVAETVAGGVINLLVFFQAFEHLVQGTGISILPYQLYYAGIYLWLIGLTVSRRPIGARFVICSLIGCAMDLSTGRITLAFTFIGSQVIFIYLIHPHLHQRLAVLMASLGAVMILVYFLREVSNQLFIGNSPELVDVGFLSSFVGGGNVADLQQLVIVFNYFNSDFMLFGSTYLDWILNIFGKYFDKEPSSVGLIIKKAFVPDNSGAPTPGAIGEAYANFGILAPFMFLVVGATMAAIRNIAMLSGNTLFVLVYSIFLTRFVFLYAKVDSTMMVNFLIGAAPTCLMMLMIYASFVVSKSLRATQHG